MMVKSTAQGLAPSNRVRAGVRRCASGVLLLPWLAALALATTAPGWGQGAPPTAPPVTATPHATDTAPRKPLPAKPAPPATPLAATQDAAPTDTAAALAEELKIPTAKDMVPPPDPKVLGPASRRILAIYDSKETDLENTRTWWDVEVVLDHLGLLLDYCDVQKGLPSHEEMAKYRGICTWFSDPHMPDPVAYLDWLTEESNRGRYVVVLGSLGTYTSASNEAVSLDKIAKPFAAWGFTYKPHDLVPSVMLKATLVDPQCFPNGGFEHKLRVSPGTIDSIEPLEGADVQPLLKVACEELPGADSVIAAIHPHGGFALGEYVVYTDPATTHRQWTIDPFFFFQHCFRSTDLPRVDLTTLNGVRLFYAHVDGDGALNLCEWGQRRLTPIEGYDFFQKLKFPITLSVVEGEIIEADKIAWVKSTSLMKDCFRRIFALPNVMPASHGCTHPFDWQRQITAIPLPGISRAPKTAQEIDYVKASEYPTSYIFETKDRAVWEKREIVESCDFVTSLSPKEKQPCDLFLWTGDCRPPASAINLATEHGIWNLNGGDGQFDAYFPSYTGLAPAVRHIGNAIQVNSSCANENIYTNGWTGNYSGFYNVTQTFARTAKPRRIKPVNIYFHYYLFEKLGSYEAVKHVFKYCESQELAPIYTRDYARWVMNSREITLAREADGWSWEHAGVCRTLRFDHCQQVPDLIHSRGVLGYDVERELDCLYVHLDGQGAGRLVWLPEGVMAPKSLPCLERASGWVDDWHVQGQQVTFKLKANGKAFVELAGLPAAASMRCELGGAYGVQTHHADADGRLRLVVDGPDFTKNLTITVRPQPEP